MLPRKDGMTKLDAEKRPYELWYKYLKETDPVTWTDQVWIDFGGVFDQEFEPWYSKAQFDLWGIQKSGVVAVRQYSAAEDVVLNQNEMILVLDLTQPKDALLRGIEFLLWMKQEPRGAGRPEFHQYPTKYPFACRPDVSSLEIALAAWKLKKQHEEDNDWPVWKIGQELSKTFPILQKQRIKECKDGSYDDLDIVSKQKELDKNSRRYIKIAEAVLAGVVNGIFPAK